MPSVDQELDHRIEEWKRRLIDLTRKNRLLYFKQSKSLTLRISSPDAQTLYQRVYLDEKPLKFLVPFDNDLKNDDVLAESNDQKFPRHDILVVKETAQIVPLPTSNQLYQGVSDKKAQVKTNSVTSKKDEIVCDQVNQKQFEKVLTNLFRRSRTDYQERGTRILHLVLGTLSWKEALESTNYIISPLVLCPVELIHKPTDNAFELHWVEEDPVVNPALVTKLNQDFKIELPKFSQNESEDELYDYFQEVQSQFIQRGWKVETSVYLDIFSFHKLAMVDDLTRNQNRVKTHPVIRGLAREPINNEGKEQVPGLNELDTIQKPEFTYQILDADSSQQQCIQSALRGYNIILQGPPGTGKSQTIANMIAEFLARGCSVLFVSEKMAALEVVYKRLCKVGLGDFCLELHSHKANKREVITTLKASLDNRLQPTHLPTEAELERLTTLRQRLNSFVIALHAVRSPLETSVYEVLSQLVRLRDVQFIATQIPDIENLTPKVRDDWEILMQRMTRVWQVVLDGDKFIWFGCLDTKLNSETKTKWQQQLEHSSRQIEGLAIRAKQFSALVGVSEPINLAECKWLLNIGMHLSTSPCPPRNWFSSLNLNELSTEAKKYQSDYINYSMNYRELAKEYADSIHIVANGTCSRLRELWKSLTDTAQGSIGLRSSEKSDRDLCENRQNILSFLNEAKPLTQEIIRDTEDLVKAFGSTPWGFTGIQAEDVAKLALLSVHPFKPDPRWFDLNTVQHLQNAISELSPIYKT